jgi:phosphomannomutase
MMSSLSCFNDYDVRGKLGDELDEGIAYRIGNAISVSEHADQIAALIGTVQ